MQAPPRPPPPQLPSLSSLHLPHQQPARPSASESDTLAPPRPPKRARTQTMSHPASGPLVGPSPRSVSESASASVPPSSPPPPVDPPSPPNNSSAMSFALAEASRIRQHLYERTRETSQYLGQDASQSDPPNLPPLDDPEGVHPASPTEPPGRTSPGAQGERKSHSSQSSAYRPDPHTLPAKTIGHYFDIYRRHMHSHWPFLYWPAISLIPEQHLERDVPEPLFSAVICLGATLAASASGKPEDRAYAMALSEHAALQTLSSLAVRRPPITVLQALLLHSIRFYGAGDLRRAWRFSSSAAQLAVDMGLYRAQLPGANNRGEPGPSLRQAQLRAVWCCFCLEKVLCAETDRPPMFRNDLIQTPPVSEIESDEFEPLFLHSVLMPDSSRSQTLGPLHAASSLNLTAKIYQVLEQILLNQMATQSNTSALRSPPSGGQDELATEMQVASWARCIELDQKLNEVASSWPERFRLSRDGRPAVPGVVCLVVWFHLCKIINFRPFILMKELPASAAAAAGIPHTISAVAATACLASASAIVQLFETIADSGLRFIAGNNALAIFTAASVLLPYSTHDSLLPVMVHECKHGVRRCLHWLAEMAITWPIAEKHKRALEEVAAQLPVDLGPPIPDPPRTLSVSGTHAASPTAAMPSPTTSQPSSQPSSCGAPKRKRAGSKRQAKHHKATSPLGFGGELALRPFKPSTQTDATSTRGSNGDVPPAQATTADPSSTAPASSTAPPHPPEWTSSTHDATHHGTGTNSLYDELLSWISMPSEHSEHHHHHHHHQVALGAGSHVPTAGHSDSLPSPLTQTQPHPPEEGTRGAGTPSGETLALDSDIQALIRQSLNRDTALWDSAVPRDMVDMFDPALYSFS